MSENKTTYESLDGKIAPEALLKDTRGKGIKKGEERRRGEGGRGEGGNQIPNEQVRGFL